VRRLLLTHVGAPYHDAVEALTVEARKHFDGDVRVAEELGSYCF
jgi:ribonuclease BN (tRNA processing enzyme)